MIPHIDTLGVTLPRINKNRLTTRVSISLPDNEGENEIRIEDPNSDVVTVFTTPKGLRALGLALLTVGQEEK